MKFSRPNCSEYMKLSVHFVGPKKLNNRDYNLHTFQVFRVIIVGFSIYIARCTGVRNNFEHFNASGSAKTKHRWFSLDSWVHSYPIPFLWKMFAPLASCLPSSSPMDDMCVTCAKKCAVAMGANVLKYGAYLTAKSLKSAATIL